MSSLVNATEPMENPTLLYNTPNLPAIRLVDTKITDKNAAFNVILGFIGLAQKRGTFSLDESSKLFECIKMFEWEPNGQKTKA